MAHKESKRELKFKSIVLDKEQPLGVGSYGSVFWANCDDLVCAAKIVHPTLVQDTASRTISPDKLHTLPIMRFEAECAFLKELHHPNIVQYLGMYEDPETGLPVLLMELMDESLTHFLENEPATSIPYSTQLRICADVATALSFLHLNDIVHRDLSSNNILLIGKCRAKLSDFGMATLLSKRNSQISNTLCPGTDAYMPPEALDTTILFAAKGDIFSFGINIIQILTRKFPAPGDRFKTLLIDHPDIPQGSLEVRVSEVERRTKHINSIESSHPLLPTALGCIKDKAAERPTASELCKTFRHLKRSLQPNTSLSLLPLQRAPTSLIPPHAATQIAIVTRENTHGEHTKLDSEEKQKQGNDSKSTKCQATIEIKKKEEQIALTKRPSPPPLPCAKKPSTPAKPSIPSHAIGIKPSAVSEKMEQDVTDPPPPPPHANKPPSFLHQHTNKPLYTNTHSHTNEPLSTQHTYEPLHTKEPLYTNESIDTYESLQREPPSPLHSNKPLYTNTPTSPLPTNKPQSSLQDNVPKPPLHAHKRPPPAHLTPNQPLYTNVPSSVHTNKPLSPVPTRKPLHTNRLLSSPQATSPLYTNDLPFPPSPMHTNKPSSPIKASSPIHFTYVPPILPKRPRDSDRSKQKLAARKSAPPNFSLKTQVSHSPSATRKQEEVPPLSTEQLIRSSNVIKKITTLPTSPTKSVQTKPLPKRKIELPIPAHPISITWQRERSAPTVMSRDTDAVVSGNTVYLRPRRTRKIYSYNSTISQWSKLIDSQTDNTTLAIVENSLTTIGGTQSNKIYTLSQANDKKIWNEKYPSMSIERSSCTTITSNSSLIVIGGLTSTANGTQAVRSVEVLNAKEKQWFTAVDIPQPLYACSSQLVDDTLYLLGGLDTSYTAIKSVYTCSLVDLLSSCRSSAFRAKLAARLNSTMWSNIREMPTFEAACINYDNHLLAIGGRDTNNIPTDTVYAYNKEKDTWHKIDSLNNARALCFAATLQNNTILTIGGIAPPTKFGDVSIENVELGIINSQ